MNRFTPPKKGPWIVKPHEAKGQFVHTSTGPVALKNMFPNENLRPDQMAVKTNWRIFKR